MAATLTTATRAAKTQVRTRGDLDDCWRRTAREHRFDGSAVGRLRTAPRTFTPTNEGELLARLTEFAATFPDRDARAAALEACTGAPIEQALERLERLGVDGHLLSLADSTKTTRVHRAAERQAVGLARQLAAARVTKIPRELVEQETQQLDTLLRATGARLSAEQRSAIELACSDRQLVVIEGQAGTGKSTALAAVARAHQAAGREIVVTSTGGLAAERLSSEMRAAGVTARAYSAAALDTAVTNKALELTESITLIHDEAALASTREQQRLLLATANAGARLIEVGDPRQSQPVGAGGLWPHIERTTQANHARAQLTHNVRALDPADRRDQRLFRDTHAEDALRGYHERGRVHLAQQPRTVEDQALDAAQTDRAEGKRTLVIAQTSNTHLDELNARAQAIRHQAGELGHDGVQLPHRPYQLHLGDEVQIRHTTHHDRLGALRNGTTGRVTEVGADGGHVTLQLSDGHHANLYRGQIDQADIRLAYVQHPFPAQGQTTDTAHLIVAEHATHEGSYVALTRAREQTNIYAAIDDLDLEENPAELAALAGSMSRSEPEAPSIDTPVAWETTTETDLELELDKGRENQSAELEAEHDLGWEL